MQKGSFASVYGDIYVFVDSQFKVTSFTILHYLTIFVLQARLYASAFGWVLTCALVQGTLRKASTASQSLRTQLNLELAAGIAPRRINSWAFGLYS